MATIDISMIVKAVNDASSNLRQVRDDVEGIGTSADRVSNQLRAIQVVMAGIVVNKAIELGQTFLKNAVAIDNVRNRLVVAVGTFHEADDIIESINKKFESTTANTDSLTEAMVKLTQAGLDPKRAQEVVESIGKLSLLSKDSKVSIDNMTEALVKMLDRGTTDMRAFVSGFQQVPLAIGLMAKAAGKNFQEDFVDSVKSGSYTVTQILDLLGKSTGKSFENVLKAQQNTISGAFSLLTNALGDSLRSLQDTSIGQAVIDRIKAVRQAIDNFVDGLKNLDPATIDKFFSALDNGATTAANLVRGLTPLAELLGLVAAGVLKLLAAVPPEALALGLFAYMFVGKLGAVAIIAAGTAVSTVLSQVGVTSQQMIDKVNQYLPFGMIGLLIWGPLGAAAGVAAAGALDWILTKVGDIGVSWEGTGTKANAAWKAARDQGKTAFDILGDGIKGVGDKADTSFNNVRRGLETIDQTAQRTMGQFTTKLNDAINTRNQFIKTSVNDLGLATPAGEETATGVIDKLQAKLTQLRGTDAFNSLRNQAQQYDAAVAKANLSVGMQKTLLEQSAATLKQNTAPSSGNISADEVARLKTETDALAGRTQAVVSQFDKIGAILRGDVTGDKLADLARQQGEWNKNAALTLKNVDDLITKYKNKTDVSALLDLHNQIADRISKQNEQYDKQVVNAKTLGGILQSRLALEQQALQMRAAQAELDLKINFNNDPVANLVKGTSAGQIMNQVLQQQLQLKQNIVNYDLQISQLEEKRLTASTQQAAIIDQTIAKYQQLKTSTQAALQGLSAEGVATNQLWQSIGNTIENGVVNGISGLITHTMTLQQVGVQVFNALTQAAVKYLFQLLVIKQMGGLMSGVSNFMGGGGLLGGLFAANGAIVPSGVKMFANGGIIGGPTLFGMAGEAGTEAIMPLERVGGKLGVRTIGNGGGDTHIHLSAIDTQSGIEFLLKNTEAIQSMLVQRSKLNRGMKQVKL